MQFFAQNVDGSSDNLMRSCSIPESLACEWEQKTSSNRHPSHHHDSINPILSGKPTGAPVNPRHLSNSPIKSRNCRTDLCGARHGRLQLQLKEAQDVIRRVIPLDIGKIMLLASLHKMPIICATEDI